MRRILPPLMLGVLFVAVGVVLADYGTYLLGRVAVFVILTIGMNLLIGVSGLLSLASAAFMGVGAYATTILMADAHFPVWLAIPTSVVIGWLAGWLLGLVSLRLSHFYLALISLGFLLAFQVLLLRGGDTTGGGYGLVSADATVFGHFVTPNEWAYTALFLAGAGLVLAHQLSVSRVGRAWRALRHNETMAELCGVNLLKNKTSAFALSSALAALAGGIYAFLQGAISPAAFAISSSVDQLAYVIVGGLASVWGALLGPLVLQLMPEYLRGLGDKRELVFGIMLLLVLIVAPKGLAGLCGQAVRLMFPPALRARVDRVLTRLGARLGLGRAVVEPDAALIGVPPAVPRMPPVSAARGSRGDVGRREIALSIEDVSVHYGGVRAVEGASFEVHQGSLHGLIGPNGAGKTTLLNALTGLVSVTGGSIRLGSTELRSGRQGVRRRSLVSLGVSRTFQTPLVAPDLSAIDNVMLGLHSSLKAGLVGSAVRSGRAVRESRDAREECVRTLGLLGVGGDLDAPASTLGFGELRRIELARSLVARPRLLILDEPTSGLELDEARHTVEMLRALQFADLENPLTILLVEHNVPLVFGLCDRVTAMHEGRILVTGDPDTVRLDEGVRESYLVPSASDDVVTAQKAVNAVGAPIRDHSSDSDA